MLTIYIDKVNKNKLDIVKDVEKEFMQLKIKGTEIEKKILMEIEQAQYNDSQSFIDRFGFKLHWTELSTGCKAALCVVNRPDKIIDLIECGNNARDIIVSICDAGNVLIKDTGITFKKHTETICVKVDNYKISSIDRLNKYIFSERPFEPDMSMGGIEYVQD